MEKMRVKIASFGVGLLAGLGSAIGYSQVRHLRLKESDVQAVLSDTESQEQELFKYGRPEAPHSLHTYTSYSVLYDHCRKVPLWSAELISKHHISGSANRKKSKFQPDPQVPLKFSSTNDDYKGSGWSRGHMTPAGDCKHCQDAMDDTHYLTNIVPQDFKNNSGYWCRLEIFCRDLTKKYSTVRVISGPLYLPYEEGDKKYVKYQVIGPNNVAVPTHLYKVILAESDSSDHTPSSSPPLTLGAFIIPNSPLGDEDLSQFQTTLSDLETLSGISFHSKLDTSQVADLCVNDGCKLMTAFKLKQFVYTKRLRSAKDVQEIEKILSEAMEKEMTNADILQAASERRSELQNTASQSQ